MPFFEDAGPIRDEDFIQSGGDGRRNRQGDGRADVLVERAVWGCSSPDCIIHRRKCPLS